MFLMEPIIVFLHCLDSGKCGKKANYLRRYFRHVIVPDLQTGGLSWNSNSFMVGSLRNLFSIASGNYYNTVCTDVLARGCEIATSAYKKHHPGLIVASSLGGAFALEVRRQGIASAVPMLLLAPALKRLLCSSASSELECDVIMDRWYQEFNSKNPVSSSPSSSSSSHDGQGQGRGRDHGQIIVVHGALDTVVPLADSEELCRKIGARIIVAPNSTHSLNDFLLDGWSPRGTDHSSQHQGDHLRELIQELL